jgi:LacI family transcriptional regulator
VPSNDRITVAQIAERGGVSLPTVSLVLRERPGVGLETRQRVMDVAKDLGCIAKKPALAYAPALANNVSGLSERRGNG